MRKFRERLDTLWNTDPDIWSIENILQYQTLNQYRCIYPDEIDCPLDLCRAFFDLDNKVIAGSWL